MDGSAGWCGAGELSKNLPSAPTSDRASHGSGNGERRILADIMLLSQIIEESSAIIGVPTDAFARGDKGSRWAVDLSPNSAAGLAEFV